MSLVCYQVLCGFNPGQWLAKINNLLVMLLNYFLAKQLSMTRAVDMLSCSSTELNFVVMVYKIYKCFVLIIKILSKKFTMYVKFYMI